ncbi:MAG: thioredoxin family protein [Planctomycetota bacterium]|jgi:peroxiredoxin
MHVCKVITLLAVPMIVAAVASAGSGDDEKRPVAKVGEKAPDFALKDADGKELGLSSFSGKVVVLEWINQRCPVSRGKHQDKTMQNTCGKFKDQPVVWLAVDSSHYADPKANKEYAAKMGLEYPLLHDTDGKVGKLYEAKTTPHMFVIDKSGVLVYAGAIDNARSGESDNPRNYVAEAVDAVLKGSTVSVSSTKPYGCSVKYAK